MKYKFPLFFILGLLGMLFLNNSCKKDTSGSITNLFAGNPWQLASEMRYHYVGDTLKTTDTLNTLCDTTQIFTFKTDKTCTYTNFDCLTQPTASGHWSLSANQLLLSADMVCRINAASGSVDTTSKPFATAQVINVGQYSLVLRTGNLDVYYPPTEKRDYIIYGFVRVKNP